MRLPLAVALLCLALPVAVRGDDTPKADPAQSAWMSEHERQAFDLVNKDQMVTARRVAEQVLAENPDSIVGHYVLGRVLHESEGVLGSAMFHLGRARELLESRYPPPLPEDAPWKFHRDLLISIATLAGEIEDYDYQLSIMDFHDQLYKPELVGERAWPLMKLGRIEEARAAADKAKAMRDLGQSSLGLNVLCAIERSTDDRDAARAACNGAFEHAKATEAQLPELDPEHQSTLAIHAYNAALAARAAFAPTEAEQIAVVGTKRLAFTPANPWRFLVLLYLDEGRGADAANALREMQRWRLRQPPQLRDQDRAENDVTVAVALALTGRTESALRLMDRALEYPDRRGLQSTAAWAEHCAHLVIRRAVRRTHEQLVAEAAATTGEGGVGVVGRAQRVAKHWSDDEAIVGDLDDDDRLMQTFQLFGEQGATTIPTWLYGDLVYVLGPGVVASVLGRVRAHEHSPKLEPYWEAFEAEVELARGHDDNARALADKAYQDLPQLEVLLRARTLAVAAEAAHDSGDSSAELSLLERAYSLDPSVVRRRGIAIPARFQGSGSAADEVISLLRRSPRFRDASDGFLVTVAADGRSTRICLGSSQGNELRCVPEQPTVPEKPPSAEQAVEDFHQHAFAVPLGLTAIDTSSLDGSTTAAEQAVREQIDQMLDDVTK
jgi:tetratricopeptide (TPR) repeat protein